MEPCYKTFVSIGNGKQYFTRLLDAVDANSRLLSEPVLIQHGHTPYFSNDFKTIPFVSMDEFIRHIHDADILILHAGAGSIMNAIKAGKRPIVMPRLADHDEIVNDHQVPFAKILHDEGKVIMVQNANELAAAIQRTKEEGISLATKRQSSRAVGIIKQRLASLLNVI